MFKSKSKIFDSEEAEDAKEEKSKKDKKCYAVTIKKAENGYTIEKQTRDYDSDSKLVLISDLSEAPEHLEKAFKE